MQNEIKFLDFNQSNLIAKMPISNMTLVKVAAVGGVITVSMGYAWRMKINRNIAESDSYKDAMKTLRQNKGAVYLLGEPIKDLLLDVGNTNKNYTKDFSQHYEVPLKGTKQRGTLHYWADRKAIEEKWNLNRIELELKNEPDRRLLIKGMT